MKTSSLSGRSCTLPLALALGVLGTLAALVSPLRAAPPQGAAYINGPLLRECREGPLGGVRELVFVTQADRRSHY